MNAYESQPAQPERPSTSSETSPFSREKHEINQRALNICEFVLQSSAEKARDHYALSETNPHALCTPLVIFSADPHKEHDHVGQIRLFKPASEAFEPHNTVTEVRLGWCAYTPFANENGRNSRYSIEYTMDGRIAYVQWRPEIEKTEHAYIKQAEHDGMHGARQPVHEDAVRMLASIPKTLEYIETAAHNNIST